VSVLVTGGRGYLGRHVVRRLVEEGHRVVDYSRDLGPSSPNPLQVNMLGELFDLPRFIDVIRQFEVDRIIHTAAQSHPDVSVEMPLTTIEANVTGSCYVLEAARLTGVKRVVVFSSECAYGHTPPGIVREDTVLNPRTPYGVTKAATEMLGRAYSESFGLDVIALRSSQIYGPGQIMQEYVRDAIKTALSGEVFVLPRGSDQKFQLVHVSDVAGATIAACLVDGHGQSVYNVTGGDQTSFADVLDLLTRLIPGARFEVGPGDFDYDIQGPFDITAARRDLGYEPRMTLEQGLTGYIEWLRSAEF
jgi:UDP-glucose 4-epimerase